MEMDSYDFHLQTEEPDSVFIYAGVKREAIYWSERDDTAGESPWEDRTKSHPHHGFHVGKSQPEVSWGFLIELETCVFCMCFLSLL